jgi:hypothetical protein
MACADGQPTRPFVAVPRISYTVALLGGDTNS